MLLAIALAPAAWQKTNAAEQNPPSVAGDSVESTARKARRPRQILLDVRVVTMKPRDRSKLGTWQKVTLRDDESAVSPKARTGHSKIRKPFEAQLLHAPDPESTECLLGRIKTLEEARRLHSVANPQILVVSDDEVLLKSDYDEWFLIWGLQGDHHYIIDGAEMESYPGPGVSMTAHVGDSNDITIATASEVSNRGLMRHLHNPDSEIVIRRSETYSLPLKDGGTMAWAGLVQCDPRAGRYSGLGRLPLVGGLFCKHQAAKRTSETVIFVTALIVPDLPPTTIPGRP